MGAIRDVPVGKGTIRATRDVSVVRLTMGVNTGVLSVGREAMGTTMDMPIGRGTRGTICDVPVGQGTVRATYLYEAELWESPWTYVLYDKGPWEPQMTKDHMSHQGRTFTWEPPRAH